MQKNASSPRASDKASPTSVNPQLSKRLAFLELDDAACARIRTLRPVIERELKKGLDRFYERIRATPEVRVFFKDESHIGSAKSSQLRHWDAISNGAFDAAFFEDVRKVGNTHARIGLSPQWYIGGYAVVVDHLIKEVVRESWPAGFARRGKGRGEALGASVGAMVKAVLLDMDLAISIYLEALDERRRVAEDARQKADQAALDAVAAIAAGLSDLAAKKLNTRIVAELPETYRKLKVDFDAAATQLRVAMQGVVEGADAIHASSHEILNASEDLARRTEQQAANLEETAAALSGITVEVRKAAGGADQAQKIVKGARSEAESSSDVVRNAILAMGRIEKSSGEIGKIIGVVDEIAFQTNLLALNAGVEAARAGEFGRGFAVVASEVRALAQRSAEAAREIKGLVKSSSEEVANGVKLVGDTGESLTRIVAWVAQIETTVTQIAASTEEQSAGLSQVNTAMGQIDQLTQQNAAMAEQATAASRTLSTETERLADLVAQFGVERAGGRARHAPAPVASIAPPKPTRAPAPRPAAPPRKVVNGAPDSEGWSEF